MNGLYGECCKSCTRAGREINESITYHGQQAKFYLRLAKWFAVGAIALLLVNIAVMAVTR